MSFSTPSYVLSDLFARIDRGDLQLPDFQRSFVWDVDRCRSLLVTVLRGYPLGTLMTLDVRGEVTRFKPRVLEGAPDRRVDPGWLLLDGQQRLTTLYHTLTGDGFLDSVDFRNKRVRRKFYLDLNRALEGEFLPDEAVFSTDENGEVQTHFGPFIDGGLPNAEAELANEVVPLSDLLTDAGANVLFDVAARGDVDTREHMKTVMNRVIRPLARYSIPMIRLDRQTPSGGIGAIFANVNSAGLQMGLFDLLTAVFATEDPDYHLGQDWEQTKEVLSRFEVLGGISQTDFLTAVTLLVTHRRGRATGQREDILQLTLHEYKDAADTIRAAFARTAKFLRNRHIFSTTQVPFTPQIVALAAILAIVGAEPEAASCERMWDRIYRWFWCGLLGELYGSAAVANRMSRDVNEVPAWALAAFHGDDSVEEPATVRKAQFTESRLFSIDPESTAYKGLYALIMCRGARDWHTGVEFDAEHFDELDASFHYIFPPRWSAEQGIDPVLFNSVLNRAPMGRRTQMVIGSTPPSRYLPRIQSKSLMEDDEFDDVLGTSLLNPRYLRNSDAEAFFADRRRQLIAAIEAAMGNKVKHDVNEDDLRGGQEGPDAFNPKER